MFELNYSRDASSVFGFGNEILTGGTSLSQICKYWWGNVFLSLWLFLQLFYLLAK